MGNVRVDDNGTKEFAAIPLNANYTGDFVVRPNYAPVIDEPVVNIVWRDADQNDGTFYLDVKTGSGADDYETLDSQAIGAAAGKWTPTTKIDCLGVRVRYVKGTCTAGTFDVNMILAGKE